MRCGRKAAHTAYKVHVILSRHSTHLSQHADKRLVYLIEQEMSTLRQGNMAHLQYYGNTVAAPLNEKYRADALCVFNSGTRKSLSDVLFSARPSYLPFALALAKE